MEICWKLKLLNKLQLDISKKRDVWIMVNDGKITERSKKKELTWEFLEDGVLTGYSLLL